MTAAKKPWHIAPECPKCKGPGKPWEDGTRPTLLVCCACGWHWEETNLIEIAKAWFGQGANEAREELEARGDKYRAAVQRLLVAVDELPRISVKPYLTDGDLSEVDEAARLIKEFMP